MVQTAESNFYVPAISPWNPGMAFISYLKIVRRIIWENHVNAWNGA